MPLPIVFTLAYLAVNLALMLWLERERARDRVAPPRWTAASGALRYGPPLAGAVYLVALSGDWAFVLFVLAFFAGAFWLLDGLLAYTTPGPEHRRSVGGDEPVGGSRSGTDRNRT